MLKIFAKSDHICISLCLYMIHVTSLVSALMTLCIRRPNKVFICTLQFVAKLETFRRIEWSFCEQSFSRFQSLFSKYLHDTVVLCSHYVQLIDFTLLSVQQATSSSAILSSVVTTVAASFGNLICFLFSFSWRKTLDRPFLFSVYMVLLSSPP